MRRRASSGSRPTAASIARASQRWASAWAGAPHSANSALPLVASISYYGGSIAPGLLDRAATLHGPQLFFWGGRDRGIPPEQHRAVADAVRAAGKHFVDVEFSWANHGFATAHDPDPAAARQASALAMAFLHDALDGAVRG